jgi:hypothetical protein
MMLMVYLFNFEVNHKFLLCATYRLQLYTMIKDFENWS